MRPCPECGDAMVKLAYYDPDGTVPLAGVVADDSGDAWVCCGSCANGLRNRSVHPSEVSRPA